jgi:hypothetical protein
VYVDGNSSHKHPWATQGWGSRQGHAPLTSEDKVSEQLK